MSGPLIELADADIGYNGRPVLKGINCSVEAGCLTGLVGPNGCGKTTFLRAVLGLIAPAKGRLSVRPGLRTAYVPQADEANRFWPLTLREVVLLPARAQRPFGRLGARARERAEEALSRVGLESIADQPLSQSSGGQRQRALLAQAIAQDPEMLVLDEPTRGLDVVAERDLLALISDLKARSGVTVLLVTHTLQIPLSFADRILLFKDGAVIQTSPDELIRTKKLEQTYGVPFLRFEQGGARWVLPQGSGP